MDINSLLSPSDTPRSSASSTPNSPSLTPFKFVQRTQSGPLTLKQLPGASPLSQSVMTQSSIPAHVLSPAVQQVSSPLISPVPASHGVQMTRSTSTQSLDTMADLAAIQNQHVKSAPLNLKNREFDQQQSPSLLNPALTATFTSNPRASFDINMMEAPKQNGRVDFTGTSLPAEQQEMLNQLAAHVQDTPSAYESHAEIIKILHQGFTDHIYPPSESGTRRDPRTYDLLSELRSARENMEKLFAVGEHSWADWLQDESILARTAEERIEVVEKCRKAVEEEVGSVRLWIIYGDWVRHCYEWAHDTSQERQSEAQPDEERMIGRDLFTWQLVVDTWQEAVDQTALDLAQSHLVWDKYLAIQIPDLQQKVSSDQTSRCLALFEQRLEIPHAMWDETFQMFSNFVSANFDAEEYEKIMSTMVRASADAKKKWSVRESYEAAIERAQSSQDRDAEYHAFVRYLEWEQMPEKRKRLEPELTNALFQRAELRFASDTTLWEEHVSYLLNQKTIVLPVLERATKHCPWSGSLWSQSLLSSDRAGQLFHETEAIKHKATNTGLLEVAGLEEVVKVHAAWCSYLRRRSFRPDGSEEDLDVAEMGIRSSIENVASLAAKLGLGNVSDPAFRLHRIYINFLSESGRWDNARQEFDNSVHDYGYSWEFWMLFYHWEMGRWRRFASHQQNSSNEPLANVAPPHLATAVLKKALEQPSLDYPEPIVQALITHCEDYEDADELQTAVLKVQKVQKVVSTRRRLEAALNAESASIKARKHSVDESTTAQSSKRKRDVDGETDSAASKKKPKNEDPPHQSVEKTDSSDPKRDRENATVLVENLAEDITDTQIRQYFSNCGVVRALKVVREEGISAIIEFDDDEAARYALSRDGQELDGAIISVTLDTGSTLYLTNYKPTADEAYIRGLLEKYGAIISIRFPSLQGNKKRRFCYVQFKLPSAAQAATGELDDQQIDGFALTCKISNPAHRQARKENNVNDGRTVFVGQLNFKATEQELEELFAKHGSIEKIRMPLHPTMKSRNKGIAYITYNSFGDAAKAAAAMNGASFKDRNLTVEVASNKNGGRRHGSSTRSVTPAQNVGSREDVRPDASTRRDRQVFLSNVPDTVNEARIRSIADAYGTVIRVTLKTNHQGAIIEYSDAAEAGQASLQIDGHEIVPGRQIQVTNEAGMLSKQREIKLDGFAAGKEKSRPKPAAPIMGGGGGMVPVRRPLQPGVRKGGNLGQRSAALHQGGGGGGSKAKGNQRADGDGDGDDGGEPATKKSNDDFRAMLTKKES